MTKGFERIADTKTMKKILTIAAIALAGCAPAVADSPTTTIAPTTTTTITEDMPEWDCETMGNRVCGTEDTEDIIAEALALFDAHGMELPGFTVEETSDCNGFTALHSRQDGRSLIKLCDHETDGPLSGDTPRISVLVHELAHAWDYHNLTDADRDELLDRWNLDHWDDYDEALWAHQGAERLAIAIAWELTGDGLNPFNSTLFPDIMEVASE